MAKYVDYLKQAYIIDELPQYSTKAKRELSFYGKIYDADVALNSIRVKDNRYDLDYNLENIVYNELIYMGYELSVFSINGREIDFRATKRERPSLFKTLIASLIQKHTIENLAPLRTSII